MLDINFIRENPDAVKKALRDRGVLADVDGLLKWDEEHRRLLTGAEKLKRERNLASQEIGKMVREGRDTDQKKAEMKTVSQKIKEMDAKVGEIKPKMAKSMLDIPNIPHNSVPIGPDASANKVIKEWGKQPQFKFTCRDHIEIAESLNLMDFKAASKIAGTGFALFRGVGARLERALINFMLDIHTKKHGYVEISPPYLATRRSMTGTGQLPKLEEDMYSLKDEDLFLIPTAEVPLTNIHQDEILGEDELPYYYTAYTPCFRREAGSYGKETKGLTRVHQFDKVELVKIVKPEDSYAELEVLLKNAEEIMQKLAVPYRVSALSTGDISFAASKCYDIEGWAPGCEKHLEISSCSNFEDFQARRINIRYRRKEDKKLILPHTLNGSGVALPRLVVCLLENHQQKDGSILIPRPLRPYLDGLKKIRPE